MQHLRQFIGRRGEPQGLPRALVLAQRDLVQVCLTVSGEIGSFWEVLAQQAVGVLVAATLPGAARIAEGNANEATPRF